MMQRPLMRRCRAVLAGTAGFLVVMSLAGFAGPARGAAGVVRSAAASQSCPSMPYEAEEQTVAYGQLPDGTSLYLDEYRPTGDAPPTVPGVVLIHGGGWVGGDRGMLTSIGDCLAENGFDAFAIDYALAVPGTSGSFPENLQDINEAIGWAKANVANLNTAKIFALGTSAGGNLADLAGENAMGYQDGLQGVITLSGPADLSGPEDPAAPGMGCASSTNCQAGSPGDTIEKYLGCYDNSSATCTFYYANGTTRTGVPAATAYADASPTASLSATAGAPPFLIAGSADEVIPLAQDTDLDQLLNAQCAATSAKTSDELVVLPGDQHALSFAPILTGSTLGFLNAIVAGTLPANCGTASPLTGAAMTYDAGSSAQTAIMFGGCCTSSGTVSGSTESYNTATGTWSPVTIIGASPPPRVGASFGYDPTTSSPVLFGGEYLPGGSVQPVALNDTWELYYNAATNKGAWTQVDDAGMAAGCMSNCPGAPPPRYAASADQAPSNQGLVLYGGENVVPSDMSAFPAGDMDTWLWASGAWTQLTPAGNPGARYGAALAYDAANNTDVLFGGDYPTGSCPSCTGSCEGSCLNLLNDTWSLTYDTGAWTWAEQAAAPAGLTPREFPAMASARAGAALFGGLNSGNQLLTDTWTWNGSAWTPACTSCTLTPPASFGAGIAYHRADSEDLLYGGYNDTGAVTAPATTWIWNGTTWTDP
jgi:acetyl esterase/lipase